MTDLLLLHAPSVYDFRERAILYGAMPVEVDDGVAQDAVEPGHAGLAAAKFALAFQGPEISVLEDVFGDCRRRDSTLQEAQELAPLVEQGREELGLRRLQCSAARIGVSYSLTHLHSGPQVHGSGQSQVGPQGQIRTSIMFFLLGWRWPDNAADVWCAKLLQCAVARRSLQQMAMRKIGLRPAIRCLDVGFRCAEHSQHRRGEVDPAGGPEVGEDGRSRGAGGIDAEAGDGSEDKHVERNQNANQVAGVLRERRPIRDPKHDEHEQSGHKVLREKCAG